MNKIQRLWAKLFSTKKSKTETSEEVGKKFSDFNKKLQDQNQKASNYGEENSKGK